MTNSRENRAAEIQNSIRQILYREWDPIGVAGEAPEDEYDSYIAPVYRILTNGGSEQELVNYLARTGDGIMGGTRTPVAYYEQLRQVARKLLQLDVRL
jgi:hypothetical protein